MGDAAGHCAERPQPLLLDNMLLGGLEFVQCMFEALLAFAQLVFRPLAHRDVFDAADKTHQQAVVET